MRMADVTASSRPYDPIDLSSRSFWASPAQVRERSFAALRRDRPLSWHPPAVATLMEDPDDPGFWAVVRHADIVEVSRRTDVFVSGRGVIFENVPEEMLEMTQSFLSMDDPRHAKLRRLVSAAFTPRQIARIGDRIEANAKVVVQELTAAGSGVDFVAHCASQLPLRTFSDMFGVEESERAAVCEAANDVVSAADPVHLAGRDPNDLVFAGVLELHRVALQMAEARRSDPADDLMTSLVQAEVDGERLLDEEISAFFVLLSVAGNDTTRQTTSHALRALTDHPEQRRWLLADLEARIGCAVEEFLRWATPVMTFRRTAAEDLELHGQHIAAGEKVVMFYPSGNWDSAVFTDPNSFDLARNPNPHVAFGGGGSHFCLGAQLARTQLRAIFRELLVQLPDICAGEPRYLVGNFIHAVGEMPCRF
jgi:cytochrome P450